MLIILMLSTVYNGRYWVFFTDKGNQKENISAQIERVAGLYPSVTVERRMKAMGKPADRGDLPVYPPYIDSLKKLLETAGGDPAATVKKIRRIVDGYPSAVEAAENLNGVIDLLRSGGLDAEILLDAGFARGLEYYTGLIFEVYVPEIDIALGGGGRYDRLVELFGGVKTPAVGVAMGMDRLLIALEKQGASTFRWKSERLLVIPVERSMIGEAFKVASMLREKGFCAEVEIMGRSVTRALSDADRRGILFAVILGPKEMREGKAVLRHMIKRKQWTVDLDALSEKIRGEM